MHETSDFPCMWRRAVRLWPERVAVEVLDTVTPITYAQLHHQALSVARRLANVGAGNGRLVGLRTHDRRRFCVGLLGTWLAGAVPVPLSAAAPVNYVDRLARRVRLTTVLVDDDRSDCGIRPTALGGHSGSHPDPASSAGLAYVMHTSGSTGDPKPVAVPHRAVAAYCTAFIAATSLDGHDRVLQLAPVTFDVVFEELLPVWAVGGTTVLSPRTPDDPGRLLTAIEDRGVTVAELTTAYWALLLRYLRTSGRRVPPGLRLLLVGGEPASVELIRESLDRGLPLAHVYGVTEAGITSTIHFFDRSRPVTEVSVGTPLANSTVYVVDEGGHPVVAGVTGEVWIGGASLADGYLGDPRATAHRFVDAAGNELPAGRYYRTGDTGRLTADGNLEILGRMDSQVKVNGVRVDPSEVEAALTRSPQVAQAAVVTVDGPGHRRRILGFVVPTDLADASDLDGTLRRFLGERLPRHLMPERIVALDVLPVTDHGKIDRLALRRWRSRDCNPSDIAESTATQRLVSAAWTAAIGRAPSSLDQNFGDAGGDSLALLAVVVALQERGFTLTVTDCLTYPTVRDLAAFLDHSTGAATPPPSSAEQHRQALRRQQLRRRQVRHRDAP